MAMSQALFETLTDLELCVWAWVAPDERLETSTDKDCWLIRIMDPDDRATILRTLRVPAGTDHMPNFSHPDWPAARAALEKLRCASA